jgi:hypothetical protein
MGRYSPLALVERLLMITEEVRMRTSTGEFVDVCLAGRDGFDCGGASHREAHSSLGMTKSKALRPNSFWE